MEQITIKELAPYLPYGLKGIIETKSSYYEVELVTMNKSTIQTKPQIHGFTYCEYKYFKPLLKPLSDLTKEIEHNGKKFVPIEKLEWDYWCGELGEITYCEYGESPRVAINVLDYINDYHLLLEWHFDVFDLIGRGLALNLNELK